MFNDSMKDELRPRLRDYVNLITRPSKGRDMFVCPICGSGSGQDYRSDGAFHVTGNEWFCFSASCNQGGDIFDLYAIVNGLDVKTDFPQIIDGLADELGVTVFDSAKTDFEGSMNKPLNASAGSPAPAMVEPVENKQRRAEIESFASKLPGSSAEAYLRSRGFSDETIKKFRFGFNPYYWDSTTAKSYQTVVIPYPGMDYYTERLIEPGDAKKYHNQTGKTPLFYIKNPVEVKPTVYITEGQLDAIALNQAGAQHVVACHFVNVIEENLKAESIDIARAVIVADRDPETKRNPKTGKTPGEKYAEDISGILNKFNIPNIIVYPSEGCKDVDELLVKDEIGLVGLIGNWRKQVAELETQQEEQKKENTVNVSDFLLSGGFESQVDYFQKYKDRKTGFENLDKYLTLYPGVACLGGASSLGKTTFAVNLCDNLLERGESVLYFSLEQLPIEIVSKSLARRLYLDDPMTTLTNIDIKNGASSDSLEKVKRDYAAIAKNYQIVKADFYWTADDIKKYVEDYIKKTGIKPIVVIDYLQLISPPEGFRGTQREITDFNLKAIKDMSKTNELFVLLISSFNRASYIEPVSYESFKESGMIEFTCDYIFGLQLSVLEDSSFYTKEGARGGEREKNLDAKRKAIHEAQRRLDKEVELVSLKNRNGKQAFKCFFKYRMDYDYFRPDLNSKHDPDRAREYQGAVLDEIQEQLKKPKKRETQREALKAAFERVRMLYGDVTLMRLAEELDLTTGQVKNRIKEYGGFTIDDGAEIESAGANTIIDMPEFNSVTASSDIPFDFG